MPCEGILTADMLFDCLNGAVAGLEADVLLINRKQIDLNSITYDANNKMIMNTFQLLAGNTGYLLQGVKQVNSSAFELVKKDTGADKKKHIFGGVILTLSAANKLQLESMSEGGSYVAIVHKKYKGLDNEEAFDVLGIDSGLELNVATYNSNEADGTATFELSSVDGFEEPKFPVNLLVGDYAATLALFNNKFIQAAV